MIDFGKVDSPTNITKKYILSKVDESQIFYHYFGPFELKKAYPSKLRRDRNPSTYFRIGKDGDILYIDLARREVYNCFTFVAKLFSTTYHKALNIIASDFGLVEGTIIKASAQKALNNIDFDKEIKKQTIIQIAPSKWHTHHISYWKQYYIDIEELKKNNVHPVSRLFINKKEIKLDELCFAYLVKSQDGATEYLKIYQPFSEQMKWVSNVPLNTPFGLHELNYNSNHIIIGKAQKDRLVLLKFFNSVIGTQNESESALQPELATHLCNSFPRRTIIWDADQTGVENCKKFNSKGFGYFNTPAYLLDRGIKDVSDYVKAFGMKALERLLKSKHIL